jgi:hypothetical protein
MGTIIKQNSTTFKRCPKDEQHPFNRIPAKLFNLNGYQFAIMAHILSNNDDWNIVKYEIGKRVGFPERKFLKAWRELETLGYIQIKRMWGSYHYTVYEDLDHTTGTGADCIGHTTGNSTCCTGAILTTTNNNYYNNITTGTDATYYKNQFNELKELYPTSVTRKDGKTYSLKGKIKDCEKLYIEYLKTEKASHDEIINCLKVELNDKMRTGNMTYQVGLLRWIEDEHWEVYKGRTVEPAEVGYGQTIE